VDEPAAAQRTQVRQGEVVDDRQAHDQALVAPVLGQENKAVVVSGTRRARREWLAIEVDLPGVGGFGWKSARARRERPLPSSPATPTISPRRTSRRCRPARRRGEAAHRQAVGASSGARVGGGNTTSVGRPRIASTSDVSTPG